MIQINNELKGIIPPLTSEEYKSLEESILAEGCREAIILWNDIIVDGHNRYEICSKHNIEFKTIQKKFDDINEVKKWIINNQISRRNISKAQRIVLALTFEEIIKFQAKELQKRKPESVPPNLAEQKIDTRQEIAKMADASHGSVSKMKKILEKASDDTKEKVISGDMSIDEGYKKTTNDEKRQFRKELSEKGKDIFLDVDFRFGDFNVVLEDIPDNSVDIIITDPPYPIKYIDCWEQLSLFASRKLRDGGFCIAYSGQYNLYEVMTRMNKHLRYYWTFAMYHAGSTQIVNAVNIICRWKPVLIYQKGSRKLTKTLQDYFISEKKEKESHDWQQSKSSVSHLINVFTEEGDLIVDTFAGAGTTIIAAKQLNRRIIAAEIDEETFNIAKFNIHNNDKRTE